MNARLYDPLLHRFLAPDNYVQDPYNTQNFNRYGYVLNNPLKYSDPSGEMPMLLAGLAGALISVTVNGVANLAHGENFFHNWGMAALTGFVGGVFGNAIGTVAQQMSGFGKFAFQTLAHAHLGATMTGMSGANPLHGAIAGALGSMIGAGAGALLKDTTNPWVAGGVMAFSGGVAGGIGSRIAGGSFWDGFRNGFISAGLNHAAHRLMNRPKILIEDLSDIDIKKYIKDLRSILVNNGFPSNLKIITHMSLWQQIFGTENLVATIELRDYMFTRTKVKNNYYSKPGVSGHAKLHSKYAVVYTHTAGGEALTYNAILNSSLHELGHAMFGFSHSYYGVMQARLSNYGPLLNYTTDQQRVVNYYFKLWGYYE